MELIPVQEINAVEVFEKGGLQPMLEQIKKRAKSFVPDLSTKKGRDDIKSIAYQVAKSKTLLDSKGKELVAGMKETAKKIDAERKHARDFLDALKDEVRKPLTDFENAEKERIEAINNRILSIQQSTDVTGLSSKDIENRLLEIKAIPLHLEVGGFDEFEDEAAIAKDNTIRFLESHFQVVKKQEEDAAELERLRQEAAEREQEDRKRATLEEEKRIAAETERLEKERIERQKNEAARLAKEAAEKATREAEEKAKAEQERVEREKQEAIEAQEAAEQRAKEAEEKANREAELATLRERERVEAERKVEEEKTRQRKANEKHRAEIKTKACKALCLLKGVSEEKAANIFDFIADGEVPNIKVVF